jgi:hypothetical protein
MVMSDDVFGNSVLDVELPQESFNSLEHLIQTLRMHLTWLVWSKANEAQISAPTQEMMLGALKQAADKNLFRGKDPPAASAVIAKQLPLDVDLLLENRLRALLMQVARRASDDAVRNYEPHRGQHPTLDPTPEDIVAAWNAVSKEPHLTREILNQPVRSRSEREPDEVSADEGRIVTPSLSRIAAAG